MKNFFTISEASKIVNMSAETLRHYDRIGLVKPSYKDDFSKYRYYSEQELIRLRTVKLLKCMDLSLKEIKEVLDLKDLNRVVKFLEKAEKNADKRIEELDYAKTKIQRARMDYEKKIQDKTDTEFVRIMPERVILLSHGTGYPNLKDLWNYHEGFYAQLNDKQREDFEFEDIAGVISFKNQTRLFAVCRKFSEDENLKILPAGKYLCRNCTAENMEEEVERLKKSVKETYKSKIDFVVQMVVITGILQWDYQIQILLDE